tara:strand:- start:2812 stop:3141 length:330 start_codon:yes stop_codon:yes gene_type:complete
LPITVSECITTLLAISTLSPIIEFGSKEQLLPIITLSPITQLLDTLVNFPDLKLTPILAGSISVLLFEYIRLIAFKSPNLAFSTLIKDTSLLEDSLKLSFTINPEHLVE